MTMEVRGSNPQWPIEVTPIAMTMVNWPSLRDACQRLLPSNPIRRIDERRLKLESLSTYAQVLAYMENSEDFESLKQNPCEALQHVSFSFLITASMDTHLSFMRVVCPRSIGGAELCVYTASVWDWRDGIFRGCQLKARTEVRMISNRIFEYIEQAGFRDIWNLHHKKPLTDGTFILCLKP